MIRVRPPSPAFVLDANCLMNNRDCSPEMKQILLWADQDLIRIKLTEHSEKAIARSVKDRHKAWNKWIIYPSITLTPDQQALRKKIRQTLFGGENSLTSDQENDVMIALAARDSHMILLTYDGASKRQPRGILGAAAELKLLGVQVMRPTEAVCFIEKKQKEIARK